MSIFEIQEKQPKIYRPRKKSRSLCAEPWCERRAQTAENGEKPPQVASSIQSSSVRVQTEFWRSSRLSRGRQADTSLGTSGILVDYLMNQNRNSIIAQTTKPTTEPTNKSNQNNNPSNQNPNQQPNRHNQSSSIAAACRCVTWMWRWTLKLSQSI